MIHRISPDFHSSGFRWSASSDSMNFLSASDETEANSTTATGTTALCKRRTLGRAVPCYLSARITQGAVAPMLDCRLNLDLKMFEAWALHHAWVAASTLATHGVPVYEAKADKNQRGVRAVAHNQESRRGCDGSVPADRICCRSAIACAAMTTSRRLRALSFCIKIVM